jgi:hypothetical protein
MFDREKAIRSLVHVSPNGKDLAMGVVVRTDGMSVILTAAHCVHGAKEFFDNPLDHHPVWLASFKDKVKFHGILEYMDPIADIALVARPDVNDGYPAEWTDIYDEQVARCVAAEVQTVPPKGITVMTGGDRHEITINGKKSVTRTPKMAQARIKASIYTHERTWLSGSAVFPRMSLSDCNGLYFALLKDQKVKGGTSGSPAFDERGRVLGVVSTSGEGQPDVTCATCWGALPVWAMRRYFRNS